MKEESAVLKDVERLREEKDESTAETREDYTLQENMDLEGRKET